MDDMSLEKLYNIIDLCKYAEVDGEKAELMISPYDNNARLIRIGINNGFARDSFEYTYENGIEFDLKLLPSIIKYYLEDDRIRSWVTQNPNREDYPLKELILTEKENECLIQTFDKNLHDRVKDTVEKVANNKVERESFTKEEKSVEKVLKYLRIKHKKRTHMDALDENLKNELIQIIDKAYFVSKGKTLSDEQIYNFALNIEAGISKEAFDAIANDIRNDNSELINEIREYIKNEKYYENYLDEEPYISLAKVGEDLIEHGYFDYRYTFPQKTDIDSLDEEKLKETVSSNFKSKYKFLAEQKERYFQEEKEEYISVIDTFTDYLVKTARNRVHKRNLKKQEEAKFKEAYQEYKMNDLKTLVEALKLYKGGKLDSEKFEVIVEKEPNAYKVNLRLSSGTSRDNNVFKFDLNETFSEDILPIIIQEFTTNDEIKEQTKQDDKTLLKTNSNNELLIKGNIIDDFSIKGVEYSEFKKLDSKDESDLTPYEMKHKEELAESNPDIKEYKEAKDNYRAGAIEKDELEEITKKVTDKSIVVESKKEEAKEDDSKIDNGIVEKQGILEGESRYLASYFRKEILREKGLLDPIKIKEIQKLAELSEDVRTLEEAKQKVRDGTLSKEGYQTLHDYYRKLLAESIKKSGKRKEKSAIEKLRAKTQKQQDDKFEYLHTLFSVYKVQNVEGDIKVLNRTANSEVIFRNKEQLQAVEFANFWNSALGLKASKDESALGEKAAFSEESRKLFNIISNNLVGNKLQLDKIKEEFEATGIENQETIYNRLFKDDDHIKYVTSGMQKFNGAYEAKDLDVIEEPKEIKEINDAYEIAESYSDDKGSASLKIHFPKEEEDKVEVYVTHGTEKNETVLYNEKFEKEHFMNDILQKVVKAFVNLSNVLKVHRFSIPGNTKEGYIAVGTKDNIIQMTNADKSCVDKLSDIVNEQLYVKEKNEVKKK